MTLPNDDALLPCPFCGGYADLDYYHNENDDGGGRGKVICTGCGVEAVGDDKGWMSNEADKRTSKSEAVSMWDRRVEPAEILALRKRVEAAERLADATDALGEWQYYDATHTSFPVTPPENGFDCTENAKRNFASCLAAYRATGDA
jgi:hypothetical protein